MPRAFNPLTCVLADLPIDQYLGLAEFWGQTGVGNHFQTLDIGVFEFAIFLEYCLYYSIIKTFSLRLKDYSTITNFWEKVCDQDWELFLIMTSLLVCKVPVS